MLIYGAAQYKPTSAAVRLSPEQTAFRWVSSAEWPQMDTPQLLKQIVNGLCGESCDGVLIPGFAKE